jgi:hypothetical protein
MASRMLKKSLFSPARPERVETRFSPGFVLASLRGSTGRSPESDTTITGGAYPFTKIHSVRERFTTKCGMYLLASALAAASLAGHFYCNAVRDLQRMRLFRMQ